MCFAPLPLPCFPNELSYSLLPPKSYKRATTSLRSGGQVCALIAKYSTSLHFLKDRSTVYLARCFIKARTSYHRFELQVLRLAVFYTDHGALPRPWLSHTVSTIHIVTAHKRCSLLIDTCIDQVFLGVHTPQSEYVVATAHHITSDSIGRSADNGVAITVSRSM